MRPTSIASGLVLLLSLADCAPRTDPDGPVPHDFRTITRDQFEPSRFRNLYEAIASLRSNWLESRGPRSIRYPAPVLVYLDDLKLGGVDELRQIPPSTVAFVRHYDGMQAAAKWGLNHSSGVIYVSTQPPLPR